MRLVLAAAALAMSLGTASAQGGPPDGQNIAVETASQGRYIVVFNDQVANPRGAAAALARRHGFAVRLVYSTALKGFAASLPARAVAALERNPQVAYIEADQVARAFAQTLPFGIPRIFASSNGNIDIDGMDDWRVDVDVAVIDSGVAAHEDINLAGRTDCTGNPFNETCDDNSGDDGNGHGTHVAGTIGALDNGLGVVGVAPGARIWAVKVLKDNGSGWISNIVGGVDWVANHSTILVANMSLGGGNSAALCQAVEAAVADGVTFAVAAGNSDADTAGSSPANCTGVIAVSALADFDGQAGGGAAATCRSDQDDTLADFSNWGATVDIAAPGVCILSTWKDGGYNTISGTSMASPHVAGAAALLASNGGTTPAQIKAKLIAEGNYDWTDDSGDSIHEPLLDVGDPTAFAPTMEAGPGGGGPINTPPDVAINAPASSSVFASGTPIDFTGTASDDPDGDLTVNLAWNSSIDGSIGGGGNPLGVVLSDGNHTITASVSDSDLAEGSDSIMVTVGDPAPPPTGWDMYVSAIDFNKKGRNLDSVVTVRWDSDDSGTAESSDAPAADALVSSVLLTHDTNGSGTYDAACDLDNAAGNDGRDDCWDFTGLTTNNSGQVKYKLLKAPGGSYRFQVDGLTHGTYTWNPGLDVENPAFGAM